MQLWLTHGGELQTLQKMVGQQKWREIHAYANNPHTACKLVALFYFTFSHITHSTLSCNRSSCMTFIEVEVVLDFRSIAVFLPRYCTDANHLKSHELRSGYILSWERLSVLQFSGSFSVSVNVL